MAPSTSQSEALTSCTRWNKLFEFPSDGLVATNRQIWQDVKDRRFEIGFIVNLFVGSFIILQGVEEGTYWP